jgi:hypothetical protein
MWQAGRSKKNELQIQSIKYRGDLHEDVAVEQTIHELTISILDRQSLGGLVGHASAQNKTAVSQGTKQDVIMGPLQPWAHGHRVVAMGQSRPCLGISQTNRSWTLARPSGRSFSLMSGRGATLPPDDADEIPSPETWSSRRGDADETDSGLPSGAQRCEKPGGWEAVESMAGGERRRRGAWRWRRGRNPTCASSRSRPTYLSLVLSPVSPSMVFLTVLQSLIQYHQLNQKGVVQHIFWE